MTKKDELDTIDLEALANANGGLKWEGRKQSDNVEDRRPHVACTPFWPQGDKGPSILGDKAPDPSAIKVGD